MPNDCSASRCGGGHRSRLDAAKRAAVNPIARNVKMADVTDNMNLGRIPSQDEKDFATLRKYEPVLQLLRDAI